VDVSPSQGIVLISHFTPPSYPYTYTFKNGTQVHLEAIPDNGYRFNNWSGDLSGTTNPTSIVMDCDKSITANFSNNDNFYLNWPWLGIIISIIVFIGLLVTILVIRRI